eukprot:TRINITY_DN6672_c0_g1_i2.p1 TRINITY_DN6672_c0_g1~~TRINITY_DN6672_c0_g1_i2.p1  ORF type:complete len:149 (-),score=23.99 TRINITY_DN6672_c0_g1_i2:71-517(-)
MDRRAIGNLLHLFLFGDSNDLIIPVDQFYAFFEGHSVDQSELEELYRNYFYREVSAIVASFNEIENTFGFTFPIKQDLHALFELEYGLRCSIMDIDQRKELYIQKLELLDNILGNIIEDIQGQNLIPSRKKIKKFKTISQSIKNRVER